MTRPQIKIVLPGGRPARLLLGEAFTVLAVGDTIVSSWDLDGRPYALVREAATYRRGLNGAVLRKGPDGDTPHATRRLTAEEAAPVVEAARQEAERALASLDALPAAEVAQRLETVVSMDMAQLTADAAHFGEICGPVGILPPDQYLSLVVRLSEGCSWNACRFCRLYHGVRFRFKAPPELTEHCRALRRYFGRSIALRRSVFLGDANALCLSRERLLPSLESVGSVFPGLPLFSFVDAWTGQRKDAAEWRECGARGLRRVYLGLETGDPELLQQLGKPGRPEDACDLVEALHAGGIEVGVIVLLGAGEERFARTHVEKTTALLARMALGPRDIVYLSTYVDGPSSPYGGSGDPVAQLPSLSAEATAAQRAAFVARLAALTPGGARIASYHIREFLY